MKAELELDVARPETVREAVALSLRDSGKVRFDVNSGETLDVTVEADRLGPLRGGTNTALMLTRLAVRTMER